MEGNPATQVMESDLLNGILPQPVLPAIELFYQSGNLLSRVGFVWTDVFLSLIKPSIGKR